MNEEINGEGPRAEGEWSRETVSIMDQRRGDRGVEGQSLDWNERA